MWVHTRVRRGRHPAPGLNSISPVPVQLRAQEAGCWPLKPSEFILNFQGILTNYRLPDRALARMFLNASVCVRLVAQLCPTLCDPMDYSPPGSSVHGDSPGRNTGVGCHALLQGIFPTQGSNLGLPGFSLQMDFLLFEPHS